MPAFKLFEEFIKNRNPEYSKWENGLILAWGQLLYLGYHNLPEDSNKVQYSKFLSIMEEYWDLDKDSQEYEDISDWFSDSPPTIKGIPLYDKKRLRESFDRIAKKYPTKSEIIVYRTSRIPESGVNSYSLNKGQYGYFKLAEERSYLLPVGTNIIWADGIADDNEVIWNPTEEELIKYLVP
jgi:hypothetical protein